MKSKRLLAAILTLSFVSSAALVGCGAKNNNTKNENQKGNKTEASEGKKEENKDEAKDDGEKMDKDQYANVILDREPKSIDPSRSTDMYSSQVLSNIIDGLTRIEKDENGDDKIAPGIAEKWEHNEEGTVWTFHLRDAKWSDGKAVTAEDFEYGIKRTLDPKTGSNYAWLISPAIKNAAKFNSGECSADEVGVKVIDEKTIEFTLESPVAYFLDLTYFKVMMPQRKDLVEKYGDAYGSEAEHMVSCGAFILKNWEHQSKVELEKNPTYWDADKVKLEKATMHIIVDENARMNSLFNGSIDAAKVFKPEWMKKFDEAGKYDYLSYTKPSASYTYFNQTNKYFKNAKIRKAFVASLDREGIAKTLFGGTADPAYAWCPSSVQIGGEDFRRKADSAPVKKLMDEVTDPKALLIEGLKELGEDPDPAKMTVILLQSGTDSRSRKFAEFEQNAYKTVLGVNAQVDYMEWAIFNERTHKMDFEIASAGWGGDYNDPMTFFEMWKSTSNVVPTGWKNDEFDNLIDSTTKTVDQEERFKAFKRAEEILIYEDAAMSPWVYRKDSTYKHKFLKNYDVPLFGTMDLKYTYTAGR